MLNEHFRWIIMFWEQETSRQIVSLFSFWQGGKQSFGKLNYLLKVRKLRFKLKDCDSRACSAMLSYFEDSFVETKWTATHLCRWQALIESCSNLPSWDNESLSRAEIHGERSLLLLKFSLPWFQTEFGSALQFTDVGLELKFCALLHQNLLLNYFGF